MKQYVRTNKILLGLLALCVAVSQIGRAHV